MGVGWSRKRLAVACAMIALLPSITSATPIVTDANEVTATATSTPTATATPGPALTPTSTPSVIATATSARCANEPLTGCRAPTATTKAAPTGRVGAPSAKNQLVWQWSFSAQSTHDDAAAGDAVLLCVYDAGRLITTATLPTRRRCGIRPCGRVTTTSFEYVNPRGPVSAQLQTTLNPEETRLQLRARSARLTGSPLGDVAAPVTIQLLSARGTCFGAVYAEPTRKPQARGSRAPTPR